MGINTFRSSVRGCLVGGAIGDALGNPIEFLSLDGIRRQHGPGGLRDLLDTGPGDTAVVTDDTQMTLFTAEGLIRHRVRLAGGGNDRLEPVLRGAYLRWLDTQTHSTIPAPDTAHRDGHLRDQIWLYVQRAPGNACLSGLRRPAPDEFVLDGRHGVINPDSKGCGTVMRSAPFGLYFSDVNAAFEAAARSAQHTHGHPTGYLAAAAFAAIVHGLARGASTPDAVGIAIGMLADRPRSGETVTALRAAVDLAGQGRPGPVEVESLGGGWVAEEALAIAVCCALSASEADLSEALLASVNHSGDSDSTGAICGNLLGARYGEAALPPAWSARVEHRDVLTAVADDLVTAATGPDAVFAEPGWQRRYPGH